MGDELVKVLTPNNPLQIVNKVEALLVGYLAVDIFGINIVVLDDQLGVFGVVLELLNGILWKLC